MWLGLTAAGGGARAQTSDDERPPEDNTWRIEEIVVQGQRTPRYEGRDAEVVRMPVPLSKLPQSIQVLTPALLRDQELGTLSEALSNVSGVVPSAPSEIVLANPIVRGFEAEIYTDGMLGYGDTAVADPASLIGVERIEVAKGPTSVLFGGGTGAPVGGLINIVTKKPGEETFAKVGFRTGALRTVAPYADVNVRLGELGGVRLPIEFFSSADFIDEVEIERITMNPSLGLTLFGSTEILVRVGYNRVEQLEYPGLPAEVAERSGVDPFQFTGAVDTPPTTIENLSLHGSITHPFSSRIKATLQVRRFTNSFDEFAATPFFAAFPLEGTGAPLVRAHLPIDTEQWSGDASLTATFDTGPISHTMLVGLSFDATDYQGASGFDLEPLGVYDYLQEQPAFRFGPTPTLTTFLESEYRTIAGYLQEHATLFERLHILLGGRLSRYELVEVEGGQGTDASFDRFDPRVGATFEIIDGLSLFAGWSTGSRLSLFFASEDGSPPELETSRSLEGGVKFTLDELGFSGTIAGFQIVRENVPTPDPASFVTSLQTGEQQSAGAEMDLIWEPTPNLSVLVSAAYTQSEVTADTIIPTGDGIPRVPEYSGRLAARYRFEGVLDGLALGAGLTWAAEAEITLPNTFESDAYAVFDAQASYQLEGYRVGLTVQNLFDSIYFVPYQYLAQAVVRPSLPRSAFVTMSAEL